MSAESASTGSLTSVPSANGTRIASACAPSSGMPSQKAPWAQDVCRPSWQNSHVPSEIANGLTTRSPFLTVLTSEPVSSTTPMNSCPIRAGPLSADIEPYGHRSLPQMQEAVMRTRASVGCLMTESGTSSIRTSPASYMFVARMGCSSPIGGCRQTAAGRRSAEPASRSAEALVGRSAVTGHAPEADLVPVAVAVRDLADAVGVRLALGRLEPACADLRDALVEVVDEHRDEPGAGAAGILLDVHRPAVGERPDDLGRVREERGLAEEPLVPRTCGREVADADPGEQRDRHRRTVAGRRRRSRRTLLSP